MTPGKASSQVPDETGSSLNPSPSTQIIHVIHVPDGEAPTRALAVRDILADDDLRGAILAWLLSVQSANTRKAYANDLGLSLTGKGLEPRADGVGWLPWLELAGCHLLEARRRHVDAWSEHQRRGTEGIPPSRPATIARRLAAISSLYAYLEAEEVAGHNPVKHATRPRVDPDFSPTVGLTKDQVQQVLYAATRMGSPLEAVLLSLMIHCGLRTFEAVGVNVEDVGASSGHRVVHIAAKGGETQEVALPPPTGAAIDRLLEARAAAGDVDLEALSGPLLTNPGGRPLNHRRAEMAVERVGKRAGLPVKLTPHMLRHAFVTLALDAGVSLRDVQDSARHKDPRTTRRYDRARGKLERAAGYKLADYLED
jgi:integrase/recombinase XerD